MQKARFLLTFARFELSCSVCHSKYPITKATRPQTKHNFESPANDVNGSHVICSFHSNTITSEREVTYYVQRMLHTYTTETTAFNQPATAILVF